MAEQTKDIDTTMSSPDINRPTDMSRPNTPFGAEVSLDDISTRFCDGTDVREVKSKKKRSNAFRRQGRERVTSASAIAAAPRYYLFEGRLSSGFLHFRAFLFNDVLLLATPDDSIGPYFLAKVVPLWPPGDVPTRCSGDNGRDDVDGFIVVGDDGRTVFRGTPKSWPTNDIWVKVRI